MINKLYFELKVIMLCILFQTFETVNDLVEFFRKHTLILAAGDSGQTRLKHNCPRIQSFMTELQYCLLIFIFVSVIDSKKKRYKSHQLYKGHSEEIVAWCMNGREYSTCMYKVLNRLKQINGIVLHIQLIGILQKITAFCFI